MEVFCELSRSQPTVCVTCVWAGVDSAWEQKKLEARKMLDAKRAAREASHTSGARFVGPLLWNGVTLVFFFGHAFYTQGVMNFSAGISNVLLVSFNTNLLTSTNES